MVAETSKAIENRLIHFSRTVRSINNQVAINYSNIAVTHCNELTCQELAIARSFTEYNYIIDTEFDME